MVPICCAAIPPPVAALVNVEKERSVPPRRPLPAPQAEKMPCWRRKRSAAIGSLESLEDKRALRSAVVGDRKHFSHHWVCCLFTPNMGVCESGYVIAGGDKRGRFLRCSRMIESGICKNKRTVSLDTVEATVLHGIEMHLASPELVAEYVQEFYHALAELRGATENQCKKLSKRLHEIEQSIQIIVDLVVRGKSSRALMERLAELETERDATEVAMAEAEIAAPITLKPDAADNYRAKVRDLKAALAAADAENRAIAYAAIRELIDKVVIRPNGPSKRTEIDIYGRIQSLFAKNEADTRSKGVLVAGVGFVQERTGGVLRKLV